ncbi:hypothetical protein D3C76_883260 [compost metagenome]
MSLPLIHVLIGAFGQGVRKARPQNRDLIIIGLGTDLKQHLIVKFMKDRHGLPALLARHHIKLSGPPADVKISGGVSRQLRMFVVMLQEVVDRRLALLEVGRVRF